jgi:adenylate kinase family enzyme
MKRIIIVGVSGCGKTTLALELAKILKIPSYDLDEYYWNPDWQPKNAQEFTNLVTILTANENWIISGNFSNTDHTIWQRCDTIIWLDYNFLRCFYRAFTRSIKRILNKVPCCNGNYETITRLFFSRNSILAWVIKSYNKRRKFYIQLFENENDLKKLLKFKNPKNLNSWIRSLKEV